MASAQCIIGMEKYSDAGILIIYDGDDYNQGYAQIEEVFKALTMIISFNHTDLMMISDLQTLGLIIVDIILMFSIKDTRKTFSFPAN